MLKQPARQRFSRPNEFLLSIVLDNSVLDERSAFSLSPRIELLRHRFRSFNRTRLEKSKWRGEKFARCKKHSSPSVSSRPTFHPIPMNRRFMNTRKPSSSTSMAPRSMPNAVLMAARFQFRTSPLSESNNKRYSTIIDFRERSKEKRRRRNKQV